MEETQTAQSKSEKKSQKKFPVIVIPGYLAPKEVMFFIKDFLYDEGFPVYDVDLGWSTDPVPALAQKLKERVDEVLREIGRKKLNLVGVSLGGIVGLYYIKKLGGNKKVKTFVAVGTPFKGSRLSYLGMLFMPDLAAPLHDITPSSPLLHDIQNSTTVKGVNIVSICSRHDFVSPPSNAYLKGARHVVVDVQFNPLTHQYLLVSQEIFDHVKDALLK